MDLFGDEDELLSSHLQNEIKECFNKRFNNIINNENINDNIIKDNYIKTLYLLSILRLYPIDDNELLESLKNLHYIKQNDWNNNKISKNLLEISKHINFINNNKELEFITTKEEENYLNELLKSKNKKLSNNNYSFSDDEEFNKEYKTIIPDIDITNEEIDELWTSSEFNIINENNENNEKNIKSLDIKKELNALLGDNIDMYLEEEDLEAKFMKISLPNDNDNDNIDNESVTDSISDTIDNDNILHSNDIEDDLSFVLGADYSFRSLPSGKIDKQAFERSTFKMMVNLSNDDIDYDVLSNQLITSNEDIIHENNILPQLSSSQDLFENEENEEEDIIYEYIDEDGNPVEGSLGSDVEYEYVYEEIETKKDNKNNNIKEEEKEEDDTSWDELLTI